MMELGAGWAPWLAAGAVAARLRSIADLHLLGVEADPGRYQLMRQHFIAHRLICAAVGAEGGHARWPRIDNPANAGGARPVRETGADLDQSDADYMQSAIDSFIDVDIVPLGELLQQEPIWDLVHIDVRGWETKLCSSCIATLNTRVRRLVIGTHSRAIERGIATFMGTGCVLEHEKPTRFHFDPDKSCVEQMTDVDGLQVWRNTRLVEPFSAS
jgi:FkbM family methyltransferase